MRSKFLNRCLGVLFCFIFLGMVSTRSYAQARPSPYSNDISIGLLSLLQPVGYVSLQYEWRAGSTNSWAIRAFLPKADQGYSGFGFGGAYKFFIIDSHALTGLSVAPAAEVFFLNNSGTSRSATPILIGGDIAYKWIFGQFSVEPLASVRIGILSGTGPSEYSGVGVGIDVLLGIAF